MCKLRHDQRIPSWSLPFTIWVIITSSNLAENKYFQLNVSLFTLSSAFKSWFHKAETSPHDFQRRRSLTLEHNKGDFRTPLFALCGEPGRECLCMVHSKVRQESSLDQKIKFHLFCNAWILTLILNSSGVLERVSQSASSLTSTVVLQFITEHYKMLLYFIGFVFIRNSSWPCFILEITAKSETDDLFIHDTRNRSMALTWFFIHLNSWTALNWLLTFGRLGKCKEQGNNSLEEGIPLLHLSNATAEALANAYWLVLCMWRHASGCLVIVSTVAPVTFLYDCRFTARLWHLLYLESVRYSLHST